MSTLPLYLDYASTTPVSPTVLEAMTPYFTQYYGNPSSRGHSHGWLAEDAIEEARQIICRAFSCKNSEIIFTSGATESINIALKGIQNRQVLCPSTEHKATLDVVSELSTHGQESFIIEVDKNGNPDWAQVEKLCAKKPSLLSILVVNNETGVITNVDHLKSLKENTDCLIHLDATQAIVKIDVAPYCEIADMMSFSAHKIFGPKGIGALVCKVPKILKPLIVGGGQQRNLRSGTLNVPGIVGLSTAISEMNISKIEQFKPLQSYFEEQVLSAFPTFSVNGSSNTRSPLISNICFKGYDGERLLERFHKIAISNGSACNSASTFPSHVLTAMGLSDEDAFASLRFSFSPNTTQADLDFALEHIKDMLGEVS